MRAKIFAVVVALIMMGVALPVMAQEITNDLVFLRIGYIPRYTVTYEDVNTDAEFAGWAANGEYNMNLRPFFLGFGLEYQYVVDNDGADDLVAQFLIPFVNVKFMTTGGFYIGAGASGKYCMSNDTGGLYDYKKEIDLWINAYVGFFMPINEMVYLDFEGRFGYNLTNRQWNNLDTNNILGSFDSNPESAYDIGLYIGVGLRAWSTGL